MTENDIRSRLLEAIENNEVLLMRYSGGTQPGTIREIEPMEFKGADKIHAACYSSGNEKLFFLSKMELIDSTDLDLVTYQTDDEYEIEAVDPADVETLFEINVNPGKAPFKTSLWRCIKCFFLGFLILAIIIILYSVIFNTA